jgi:hypothetical protein
MKARRPLPIFVFPFSLFVCCLLAGCGTPGDPQPRRPPMPEAVSDLAARQRGAGVVITFTLPRLTTEGRPLEELPAIEIFREFLPAAAPLAPPARQIYTIPGGLADAYLRDGRIEFHDTLPGEDLARRAGQQAVYVVRTSVSRRASSVDSNVAAARVYPVPEAIRTLDVTFTEPAIELRWTPPERTTSGTRLETLGSYRVYRAEADAALTPEEARKKASLELLGVAPSPAYRDTQFEFGRTYLYVVRSVAQYEMDAVESEDSAPAMVTPRDTFPPAAPENLVAVPLPAAAESPARIELSWSISAEPDLAGYHLYRAEEGGPPQRLNRELLLTPAFRDISVVAGRRYTYTATAVDRAGNESPPSAAISAAVSEEPAPGPKTR